MIENQNQLTITTKWLKNFKDAINRLDKIKDEVDQDSYVYQRAALQSKIESFENDINEYKTSTLFALNVKYGVGSEDAFDIFLEIINKNKYLDLAHAMNRVRGDWSEGCDIVIRALNRFDGQMTSNTDNDISSDVWSCVENFEDGRVFRDTTWNYTKIFELVDIDILQDYNTIIEYIED